MSPDEIVKAPTKDFHLSAVTNATFPVLNNYFLQQKIFETGSHEVVTATGSKTVQIEILPHYDGER